MYAWLFDSEFFYQVYASHSIPDSLNFFMRRRYRMWEAESFNLSFISSLHKRGGDTSFPASPRILFFLMTRAAHRAVCTPAAAGGLAFFLITDNTRNNRRHYAEQHNADDYCCNVFRNPCEHFSSSCSAWDRYFVTLTVLVSFVDSLYGLNSR